MAAMLKTLLYMVIIAIEALDQTTAEDIEGCPTHLPYSDGLLLYGQKCYHFVHTEKYWTDARNFCHSLKGDLVKVDGPDVNNAIKRKIGEIGWRNKGIWIGLNDRKDEGSWRWESRTGSGDVAHWTNWESKHPSGNILLRGRDCVRMVREDGWRWHETYCEHLNWKYRFICEYEYKPPKEDITTQRNNPELGPNALGQRSAGEKSEDHTTTFVGLGIGMGLLLFLVIALVLVIVLRKRAKRRKQNAANQGSQTTGNQSFNNHAYTSDVVEDEYMSVGTPRNGHGVVQNDYSTGGAMATGRSGQEPAGVQSPPPSYATYDNGYLAALPTKQVS